VFCPAHLRSMGSAAMADVHSRGGRVFAVSATGPAASAVAWKRWGTGLDGFISDPQCELARRFAVDVVKDANQQCGLRCEPGVVFLRAVASPSALSSQTSEDSLELLFSWCSSGGPLNRPKLDGVWNEVVRRLLDGDSLSGEPLATLGITSATLLQVIPALRFRLGGGERAADVSK
jgi:hypothetical protein